MKLRGVFCFSLFYCALTMLDVTAAAAAEGKKTTLRQLGSPSGTFINTAGVTGVKHVEAKFRNVGDVAAENVRVTATLPDGQKIDLLGPQTLQRNETGTYKNDGFETVTTNNKIRASATCSNCR